MIQTVYLDDFRQAFHNTGRGDQFSYEALELIYDFLEESDPDMELDVIAICCDFEEMTPAQIALYYDVEIDEDGNEMQSAMDFLCDVTTAIGQTDSTIVFINF